ncbi:hypothetical protein SSP531S_23000 [Streptomyces spongiicola]|uniref:Uncharacterized protein n=1 Tax=Streptomyces spongiicola TaxID=1690221 RepID=A0A388SW66_9ACTN|nr:hypothetical protein [Streptomyces spongiicola]GBQ00878.1 hypothetical protein SSP531S_23000 [Streptomyces spongiicola]
MQPDQPGRAGPALHQGGADYLHQLTGGRADRLGYLLRSGAIRAIRDGTECLTHALFDDLAAPWRDSRTR